MRRLDALNRALGTMGLTPLASIDTDQPYVDAALSLYDLTLAAQIARGWHFNRFTVELVPDPDGVITRAANMVSFVPTPPLPVAWEGTRLRYVDQPFKKFTKPVVGRGIFTVSDEDLPELFWQMCMLQAVTQFQTVYDGDSTKTRLLTAELAVAANAWGVQEIQAVQANMLESNERLQSLKARTHRGLSPYQSLLGVR